MKSEAIEKNLIYGLKKLKFDINQKQHFFLTLSTKETKMEPSSSPQLKKHNFDLHLQERIADFLN